MRAALVTLLLVVLYGCSTTAQAPIYSRGTTPAPQPTVSRPGGAVVTRPALPISRPVAGKADQYIVRRGDTMYSVAWQHGLTVGELSRQNGIRPPYTIYPGQQLRVSSPTRAVAPVRTKPLPQAARPLAKPAPQPAVARPAAPPVPKPAPPVASAATKTAASGSAAAVFDGTWIWPTRGRILRGFQPNATGKKGIDIGGHHAQPVKAAASGKVVYAGSGLVGYGRLIIVKHNDNLLSAYGHNSKLLVAEGDRVKAGAMIAKMGNSGTDRTALYFEIRKDGKPVNPLHYLPRN